MRRRKLSSRLRQMTTINLKPHKTNRKDFFPAYVFDVVVPEGQMYVQVVEDNNENVVHISATIGKAGGVVNAWAASLCEVISIGLKSKMFRLDQAIAILHAQRSNRSIRQSDGVELFSGPEGLAHCLIKYKATQCTADLVSMDPSGMPYIVRGVAILVKLVISTLRGKVAKSID